MGRASVLQKSVLFLFILIGLNSCAAMGPISSIDNAQTEIRPTLANWDKFAGRRDEECYTLHTKHAEWGVFIGCQAIDIFDVRTPNVFDLFQRNLTLQNCTTQLESQGQRNYVRTGNQFLYLDKTSEHANAWYVPAGYYSDGVSTPNVIREILPGAILDTDSPRTLSAALFHDRYFCLFEYSRKAWDSNRENFPERLKLRRSFAGENRGGESNSAAAVDYPDAYRRKGCANTSFRNGLRSAGASSFISTVFRSMVGLVNPGKEGYCPRIVHAPALIALEQELEKTFNIEPINSPQRKNLPGCRAKEPIILCLSRIEVLWSLVSVQADDYALLEGAQSRFSDEFRQVMQRIMCYELQALNGDYNWPENFKVSTQIIQEQCGFIDINLFQSQNADMLEDFTLDGNTLYGADSIIVSPFRAGDFWIEAALMLTSENGMQTFLQTVSSLKSIDYAMLAIVDWNMRNEQG